MYHDSCVSPYPLSSTVILDRPDVQARLNIFGVHGTILWATLVVEPRPGTLVRLVDTRLEVDSPDYRWPISVASDGQHEYPRRTTKVVSYRIAVPTNPAELSVRFPVFEVEGRIVKLPDLRLRSERRLKFIDLMCE
jgi:hypothetical protein